ncbi:zinc ABC transporter solute-binding protein [Bacillaceae bacterium SIJ1]|uniref:metal ABC transporter solute-binding protein, Zn/Mn family n=1 Tax=Litoribacterium kuwaitense TaxID=1398745 RepID=UPI0013EA6893|nr:zinc ABC transporter substrate-binding protein [Litoribacterium kuwaitense]NGP44793.1 zinc ABC transporter solute-binding protein [Litoribacterium kuwaitense]
MLRWFKLFIPALLLFLAACGGAASETSGETSGDQPISIVTTIAQIGEPLQDIGGDLVSVKSIMGPGVDPHTFQATQSDIATLSKADIVFYGGLNLEGQMNEVFEQIGASIPVVAVSESIPKDQLLDDPEAAGAPDPHVWFDIDLWKIALESAVDELKEYAPEHAETFEQNKVAYFESLDELKNESQELLTKIPEEKRYLVTAHDAFNYFGRAFDIDVIGLQGLSTEDEIGISDIEDTVDTIVEAKVPAVFIETSVSEKNINSVIEGAKSKGLEVQLGGELFSDAMGEAGTAKGTYLGMYRHNVETIASALTEEEES